MADVDGGHAFTKVDGSGETPGDCYGEGLCGYSRKMPDGSVHVGTIVRDQSGLRVINQIIVDGRVKTTVATRMTRL